MNGVTVEEARLLKEHEVLGHEFKPGPLRGFCVEPVEQTKLPVPGGLQIVLIACGKPAQDHYQ